MNNVLNDIRLMGRLTADPEVKSVTGKNGDCKISKYSLAIDKKFGEGTDFFPIVTYGNTANWVEKNLYKGIKIIVEGYLSQKSYISKDGTNIHTIEIVATNHLFAESKKKDSSPATASTPANTSEGFMNDADDGYEYDGLLPLSDEGNDSPWG